MQVLIPLSLITQIKNFRLFYLHTDFFIIMANWFSNLKRKGKIQKRIPSVIQNIKPVIAILRPK